MSTQRKMAIFVEGQTERIFIQRLLRSVFGEGNVHIVSQRVRGNGKGRDVWQYRSSSSPPFYVLLVDCGADNRVASEILRQSMSLSNSGYECVVGLRDLHPESREQLMRLRTDLNSILMATPIPCHIVFAVMEVEAWFIAEHTHFTRLLPSVSTEDVVATLRLNPATDDVRSLSHPASALQDVYARGGHVYKKHEEEVRATVEALDMDALYCEVRPRVPELDELLTHLDAFLTP